MVAKKCQRIICTAHDKGKTHDFTVLKKSQLALQKGVKVMLDSAQQGVKQLYANSELPKKASKLQPLTQQQKAANKLLTSEGVLIAHLISRIKAFRMLADRYRHRRQQHTMRVKLNCAIYNFELFYQ